MVDVATTPEDRPRPRRHLFPQATEAYREASRLDPAEARWAYRFALALSASDGDLAEVVPALRHATNLAPSYPPSHYHLGRALRRQGRLDEAAEAFRAGLRVDPEIAFLHRQLGEIELQANRPEVAREHLERARRLDDGDGGTELALAQSLARLGDQAGARAAADRASRLEVRTSIRDPVRSEVLRLGTSALALHKRGVAAMEKGALAEAIELLESSRAIRPDQPSLHYNLGLCLERAGRTEEAAASYRRAVAISGHPGASWRLGRLAVADHDLDEARRAFLAAVAGATADVELLAAAARSLAEIGAFEDAVSTFGRALELDPGRGSLHLNLGATLLESRRPADAIPHLRRALDLDPASAIAHYDLALALRAAGREPEARPLMARAVALDPSLGRAE